MYQSKYETNPHFKEAFSGRKDTPIYLGHFKDIEPLVKDLLKNGQESRFYQNVFCPERDEDKYTFEKNVAWMLGGIKAGRPFLLISDLDHYKRGIESRIHQVAALSRKGIVVKKQDVVHKSEKKSSNDVANLGATYDEIRWLVDNGYRFEASQKNPKETYAIPSATPPGVTRSFIIKDYYGLSGDVCDDNVLKELETLYDLFNDIIKQRLNSQYVLAPARVQSNWASSTLTTSVDMDELLTDTASFQIDENIPTADSISTTDGSQITTTTTTTTRTSVSESTQTDGTPPSNFYSSSRFSNDNSGSWRSASGANSNSGSWRSNCGANSSSGSWRSNCGANSSSGSWRSDSGANSNSGSWRSSSGTNNNYPRNFLQQPVNKSTANSDTDWKRGSRLTAQNNNSNNNNDTQNNKR